MRDPTFWRRVIYIDESAFGEFVYRLVHSGARHVGDATHVLRRAFPEADERDECPGGIRTQSEDFKLLDYHCT